MDEADAQERQKCRVTGTKSNNIALAGTLVWVAAGVATKMCGWVGVGGGRQPREGRTKHTRGKLLLQRVRSYATRALGLWQTFVRCERATFLSFFRTTATPNTATFS